MLITYKIISCQNLLQNFKDLLVENKKYISIQKILYDFASDNDLDHNRRADACDVLLGLGDENFQHLSRQIIQILGNEKFTIKGAGAQARDDGLLAASEGRFADAVPLLKKAARAPPTTTPSRSSGCAATRQRTAGHVSWRQARQRPEDGPVGRACARARVCVPRCASAPPISAARALRPAPAPLRRQPLPGLSEPAQSPRALPLAPGAPRARASLHAPTPPAARRRPRHAPLTTWPRPSS